MYTSRKKKPRYRHRWFRCVKRHTSEGPYNSIIVGSSACAKEMMLSLLELEKSKGTQGHKFDISDDVSDIIEWQVVRK